MVSGDERPIGASFFKVDSGSTSGQGIHEYRVAVPCSERSCFHRHQPIGYLTTERKLHHTQVKYRLGYLHFTSSKRAI